MRTKLWAATGMALAACAGSAAAVEPRTILLNITPVPEPGYTLALMAVTIGCIALLRRKPK